MQILLDLTATQHDVTTRCIPWRIAKLRRRAPIQVLDLSVERVTRPRSALRLAWRCSSTSSSTAVASPGPKRRSKTAIMLVVLVARHRYSRRPRRA